MKPPKKEGLRITAILLLFLVSVNALAAGYSFITDPSGAGIGISTVYLRETAPFENFLIPGLILFFIIGVFSSFIAIASIIRMKHYPFLILLQGIVLAGWIVVQLTMVNGVHVLHGIVGLTGMFLILIGWRLRLEKTARSF